MFGQELANGRTNLNGRIFYWLFGLDHLGQRIRAFHVFKCLDLLLIQPKRILDAGSGDGSFCFALAKRYKTAEIVGLELDRKLVEDSQRILYKSGCKNLTIKQGDIVCDNMEELFDLIICIDVLEHIPDDTAALKNLYSSLKKKGILLLHVPQRHQLNRWVFKAKQIERQADHVRDEYTIEEITSKIIAQGFIIKKTRYTFGFWTSLVRNLAGKIEEVRFFKPALKLVAFPLLFFIARFDLLTTNKRWRQGFLLELQKDSSE